MRGRFSHSREFYIPEHARRVSDKQSEAVCYLYERGERLFALGFGGKRQKPDWHFAFHNQAEREAKVVRHFECERSHNERRAERRETEPHGLTVGTLLYTSWGWEQTNVDFFEVTRIVGEKMIEVRAIGAESEETAWSQGKARPLPGAFLAGKEPKVVRAQIRSGTLCINIDGHYAQVTSAERSHHWSSYA